ncbi:hypothetical protein H257_13198 [Aphanomyces astaci]|uniref:Uncharacterized protein n=1 Tax=Aphanomyces astaci TaxID=112090 RepID=W4FVK0_APHAT|nr:hypothetical protein H257_13198 [Aphanomyces astaci]ETV71535.1 hypothetical protein H257_13198 [Aphanomyces astaci]|eukprot:XP_009838968.1 hypothetical protein H257_13198 [Aphanomyces astaci]
MGRMMLQRRLLGLVAPLSRNELAPVLTSGEEMGIVEAVNERTMHTQCFTHNELTNIVRVCIENSHHERTVPDTFPSITFVKKFIKRHFSSRSVQAMEAVRAGRSTVDVHKAHSPRCIPTTTSTPTAFGISTSLEVYGPWWLACLQFCANKSSFLSTTLFIQYFECKVADKEAKKEKEEILVQKKKATAQKRVIAAKTKKALDERRREASERKLISLEDSSKPVRRKRPRAPHVARI